MSRSIERYALRSLVALAILGGAGGLAWRALRLPHDSDDWLHAGAAGDGPAC